MESSTDKFVFNYIVFHLYVEYSRKDMEEIFQEVAKLGKVKKTWLKKTWLKKVEFWFWHSHPLTLEKLSAPQSLSFLIYRRK